MPTFNTYAPPTANTYTYSGVPTPPKPTWTAQDTLQTGLAAAELGGGIALAATGAGLPVAIPLITAGATGGATEAMKWLRKGGYVPMEEGGEMQGGTHKSGNDLAIVHTKTGKDTGVRLEGHEMVFSRERTDRMKEAASKMDFKQLMEIVQEQMKEGEKNEKGEYYEGTNWNGIQTDEFGNVIPQSSTANWYNGGNPYGNVALTQGATAPTTPYSYVPSPYATTQEMIKSVAQEYPSAAPDNPNMVYVPSGVMQDTNPMGNATEMGKLNPQSSSPNWSNPDANYKPDLSGVAPTGGGNDWMQYLGYLPAAGQIATGLAATQTKLPQYQIPMEWNEYLAAAKARRGQGLSPEENQLFERQIADEYRKGLQNIYNASNGNGAAILGNSQNLANNENDAHLKLLALNNQQKRLNESNYGNLLGTDITMRKGIFDTEYNAALNKQQSGAALANTGYQNLEGKSNYDQQYGKDSQYALLLQYLKTHNK